MPSCGWELFLDSLLPPGKCWNRNSGCPYPSPDLIPFFDRQSTIQAKLERQMVFFSILKQYTVPQVVCVPATLSYPETTTYK